MNLLDGIIIVAAIAYGIGGFRSGAVIGIFSLVGFFGGAAAGAQLARPLSSWLADGRAQIPIAIVCVLALAMVGQLLGVWIAGYVKDRLVRRAGRPVDQAVGAVLGIFAVLLVAWMVAVPLANSPYPSLANEAGHSRIVRAVNGALPDGVRALYGSLRQFLDRSGFPPVLGDLPSTDVTPVPAPPQTLPPNVARIVARTERSVLKIYGQAPQCSRGIEGSGFVYARNRVLTNAHVVAGTNSVRVVVGADRTLRATVVVYDPKRDVAVLDVPGLNRPALSFAPKPAQRNDPAIVLGYPENGPFTTRAARVRGRGDVQGADIYGNGDITREIYSIRSVVRSGNSGGPLISFDGTVLGMVFATALDSPDTGFVLTDKEIAERAAQGRTATAAVGTGGCTPD